MECNCCNKDETRLSFDYEVVKIKHTKDYNLLSHEDVLKKFRYLFFELERMRLKRYILLEKINNVVEQDKHSENEEIAKYYSKSFSNIYFGTVVRLSGREISKLEDVENFKKDFESKKRLMLEKIRPASDFIESIKEGNWFSNKGGNYGVITNQIPSGVMFPDENIDAVIDYYSKLPNVEF